LLFPAANRLSLRGVQFALSSFSPTESFWGPDGEDLVSDGNRVARTYSLELVFG